MNQNEYHTMKDIENQYLDNKDVIFKYNLWSIRDDNNDFIRYDYYIRLFKHHEDSYDIYVFRTRMDIREHATPWHHYYPFLFKKNISISSRKLINLKHFLWATEEQRYLSLWEYMQQSYIEHILTKSFKS